MRHYFFMEIRDLSLIPTMRKKCDVKNPHGGSLNLSYNFIYSFQKTSCFLSLVHVRNLQPGANFHPGCKFAPGVYLCPCERCFKNLHPGANLLLPSRWCNFICTRVECKTNANLHPGANCAHERKLYNFNTF